MGARTPSTRLGRSLLLSRSNGLTAPGILLQYPNPRFPRTSISRSTQRIRCVAVDTGPSMLIRPDACIAWVSEDSNTNGLDEALFLSRGTLLDRTIWRSERCAI